MGITEKEKLVLSVLAERWNEYEDFCFLPFAPIAAETGLERRVVRLACRSLTRKGLAQFGRGLWTDEGELAGSGYAATRAGSAMMREGV